MVSRAARQTDPEAAAIQADFTGWRVWRATNRFGQPGDFIATRRDPQAGVDPTVMTTTADQMREALASQRKRAEAGESATWPGHYKL
jgi:hypothetical protein